MSVAHGKAAEAANALALDDADRAEAADRAIVEARFYAAAAKLLTDMGLPEFKFHAYDLKPKPLTLQTDEN